MSSSWFIVSNALDKSINKAPAKPCLSTQNLHLFISVNKAYCELKPSILFLYFMFNDMKLLGITLDSNLKVDKHESNI